MTTASINKVQIQILVIGKTPKGNNYQGKRTLKIPLSTEREMLRTLQERKIEIQNTYWARGYSVSVHTIAR